MKQVKPLKPFSRRHFCTLMTLAPLCASIRAHAAPPSPEADADLPAETLYGIGTRMLKEGRTFEKAAARFARASEKQPENPDYQIALGCAYASRAASLAWAGAFNERLTMHTAAYQSLTKELAEYEAKFRQKIKDKKATAAEIENFEQGLVAYQKNTKPPTASVLLIRDDKSRYDLTRPELVARLTELSQKALTAWDKGVALCKTPGEKAQAQYVRGWGLRLLQFYLSDESKWRDKLKSDAQSPSQFRYFRDKTTPLELKGLPTDAQIKTALDAAAAAAPDTAVYVQAQADFAASKEQGSLTDATTEIYRQAAQLDPKNANLWNRVYDRETAYRIGEKSPAAPLALDDLHKAQARDRPNAWYGYEEARRVIEGGLWNASDTLPSDATEKQKQAAHDSPRTDAGYRAGKQAVGLMERANALPRFAPPVYQDSVPPLLARAWQYVPNYWHGDYTVESFNRFMNLGRAVRFYAESLAADKNNEGATQALRVLQQAGLRITGDPLPTFDLVDEKNNRALIWVIVGRTLVSIGYGGLLQISKSQNDAEAQATLTRERDAWEARVDKWFAQIPNAEDQIQYIYDVYNRS